jgi:hypothetical protein
VPWGDFRPMRASMQDHRGRPRRARLYASQRRHAIRRTVLSSDSTSFANRKDESPANAGSSRGFIETFCSTSTLCEIPVAALKLIVPPACSTSVKPLVSSLRGQTHTTLESCYAPKGTSRRSRATQDRLWPRALIRRRPKRISNMPWNCPSAAIDALYRLDGPGSSASRRMGVEP